MQYLVGGFNGGSSVGFLKMSHILADRIKDDLYRGIIAIWHDESHINRYFVDNPPTRILDPSYCYNESMKLPFDKKLLSLTKNETELRS